MEPLILTSKQGLENQTENGTTQEYMFLLGVPTSRSYDLIPFQENKLEA